jgi:hypothetical protein
LPHRRSQSLKGDEISGFGLISSLHPHRTHVWNAVLISDRSHQEIPMNSSNSDRLVTSSPNGVARSSPSWGRRCENRKIPKLEPPGSCNSHVVVPHSRSRYRGLCEVVDLVDQDGKFEISNHLQKARLGRCRVLSSDTSRSV